jgi:hypothetical protein
LPFDKKKQDSINIPPFETEDLRKNLVIFLNTVYPYSKDSMKIGDFRWGVYAFYDYDSEPIYVGQTNEKVRTRIRRHLTNQRTDAVAMSVLDPFEVFEIAVWPLPEYQRINSKGKAYIEAKMHLNSLELAIYQQAVKESKFKIVLNEKDPPSAKALTQLPKSLRQCVVSEKVLALRSHPDFRIARRALIIARLAQVIAERKVQGGLRRVMLAQAKRLEWLADRRYNGLGGAKSVARESDEAEEESDES